MGWNVAQATEHLSEVIERSGSEGPQSLEQDGRVTAFVVSREEYERLTAANENKDFKAFLRAWPSIDDLDLKRDHDGDAERSW